MTPEEALATKSEVNRRVGQCLERTAPGLVASLERAVVRIELITRPAARACSACGRC